MSTAAEINGLLSHPMWSDASDEEIGDYLEVSPASVRERREQRAADIAECELLHRLAEIASVRQWRRSMGELLADVLDEALMRAYEERAVDDEIDREIDAAYQAVIG